MAPSQLGAQAAADPTRAMGSQRERERECSMTISFSLHGAEVDQLGGDDPLPQGMKHGGPCVPGGSACNFDHPVICSGGSSCLEE